MKSIENLKNIENKKIILRLDLNVPIKNGTITDTNRIDKILPTINFLVKKKAKIIIISHVGRPNGKIVSMIVVLLKPTPTNKRFSLLRKQFSEFFKRVLPIITFPF